MYNFNLMFNEAELSLAAYADLIPGSLLSENQQESLKLAGMATEQAQRFAEQWRVVTQYNHTEQLPTYDDAGNLTGYVTSSNGLSVTVFEEVETGKRYLSVRGTQDANDLVTDLASVAILGTPHFQSQYQSLREKVQEWLSDNTLPSMFTVSGHSLGGFLATGIASDFAANIEHAYLYNSPGLEGIGLIGSAVATILQALGLSTTVDPTKISNLKADAGISPVSGLGVQVAPPIPIVIENQFASDVDNPPAARNHSLQPLTDALALYASFAMIAPGTTVETVGRILKSANHQNKLTLEATLDSLRTLFQVNYAKGNATDTASTTPTGDREKFYTNLLALKDFLTASPFYNPDTKSLGLNVLSLADANATGLAASTKFSLATRYALLKLNPFLVAGNNDLYNQINTDHSLDLYDATTGTGSLTEQYLKDRASFLTNKLWASTNDRITESQDALFVRSGASAYFEDRGGNAPYKLYQGLGLAVSSIPTATMTQYLFGGASADTLNGGNEADHIYGMSGDDALRGNKGNDYLEGGQGSDTYLYTSSDGLDTIFDTDGLGKIRFDGVDLNGGDLLFGEIYKSTDGKYLYTLLANATGQNLLISGMGGQIIVKDFQSGELGINLNGGTAPAPTSEFHGTANNDADLIDNGVPVGVAGGGVLDTNWTNYVAFGQKVYHDPATDVGGMFFISRLGQPYPENMIFDALYGEGGDDYLLGNPGGHDFRIDGGAGNDWIVADYNFDYVSFRSTTDYAGLNTGATISGDDGNDAILGGLQGDAIDAGTGHDQVFADPDGDVGVADGEDYIEGGSGNDWLSGGNGADVIFGGPDATTEADNDTLLGGADSDYLEGGAGADTLYGDTDGGFSRQFANVGDGTVHLVAWNGATQKHIIPDFHDASPITLSLLQDVAEADAGDDYLDGGAGNDKLFGGAGDDLLDGGADNDLLYGEAGDDDLIGGDGNDKLWGDLDNATYNQDQQISETHGTLRLFNREYTVGFDAEGNDILDGGAGNDELHGGGGDDTLRGGEGADALYGMDGDDTLEAGAGNDQMVGGIGNDTYIYNLSDGQDDIFDAAGAFDTLQLAGVGSEAVKIEGIGNDLVITISGTADRLTIHDWYTGTGVIENITLDDGSALSVANVVRSYETPSGNLAPVITSLGDFSSWVGFHYPGGATSANLGNIMQALNDARIPGPGSSLAIDNTYGNPYGDLLGDIFERSGGINNLVPLQTSAHYTRSQTWIFRRDPLTFDLDGDGIETIGINATNPILFDHDGDSLKTATGWIKADDAFLVLDRNSNGTIDNGSELFGDSTPLSTGGNAADGFAALQDQDSNHDGLVNASDTNFSRLRLWQDFNQNGISETGELSTLDQKGIAAIVVQKIENNTILPNGNVLADTGSYLRTDGTVGGMGTTGNLGDVDLREDTFHSQFTDTIPLTPEATLLPEMQGSGQVRDLREAASLSPELLNAVNGFLATGSRTERVELLDSLLKTWSDTSTMPTTATGAYGSHPLTIFIEDHVPGSDGYNDWLDKITVLEHFNGRTFRQIPSGTDPVTVSFMREHLEMLDLSYAALRESLYDSIFMQTRALPYLDAIGLTVDEAGYVVLDFSAVEALLQQTIAADPAKGLADLVDLAHASGQSLLEAGWHLDNFLADALPARPEFAMELGVLYGSTTNDSLTKYEMANVLFGAEGDDHLYGWRGSDWFFGGAGNDFIHRYEGNNVFIGGAGDDILQGGSGADTYLYYRGNDNDILNDYDYAADIHGADDVLLFGPGITPSDLDVSRLADHLLVTVSDPAGTTSRLTVQYWFADPEHHRLERFRFADGSEWAQAEVERRVVRADGTEAADTMVLGGPNDHQVFGHGGNDVITDLGGNNTIDGGTGEDTINAGVGNDMLTGDVGNDRITDSGGNNLIHGDAGNDWVWVEGSGTNHIYGGEGNDTVQTSYNANSTLDGGEGDDYLLIHRTGGNSLTHNTLIGGLGNDQLFGSASADTFVYNRGDGSDTINDYDYDVQGAIDTLSFGEGIAPVDLDIWRSVNHLVVTVRNPDGTSEQITVQHWFADPDHHRLERFHFADGSEWDLAEIERRAVRVEGTEGWDTLLSGGNDNLIFGHGSDDVITDLGGSNTIDGGSGNDTIRTSGSGNNTIHGNTGNDWVWVEGNGINHIHGDEGNDTVQASFDADNVLDGGAGSDYLLVHRTGGTTSHANTFIGGLGNDQLFGGAGADTFVYNRGDGSDTINDYDYGVQGAIDTLVFGGDITVADLDVWRSVNHLAVTVRNSSGDSEQLTIQHWFADPDHNRLERFRFADGSEWDLAEIERRAVRVEGTEGWDTLLSGTNDNLIFGHGSDDVITDLGGSNTIDGGSGNDTIRTTGTNIIYAGQGNDWIWVEGNGTNLIYGDAGNDTVQASFSANNTIDGGAGDDYLLVHRTGGSPLTHNTFIGGRGNDQLFGSASTDTFIYSRGDGNDTVNDHDYGAQGAIDTIQFGAGISTNDVTAQRSGDHLLLRVLDPADSAATTQITIQWWFADPVHHHVERFAFDDGTVLGDAQMQARAGHGRPVLAIPLPDLEVGDNAAFAVGVPAGSFADPDSGEVLTYRATLGDGSVLPDWLAFDSLTGTLSGRPFDEHIGSYDIAVTAFDPTGYFATDSFTLTVINANDPPVIAASIADLSTDEDVALNFQLPVGSFVDPNEGDVLTYNAVLEGGTDLPSWLTFDVQTQTFIGTPTNNEVGSLNITVTATDSEGLSVSDTFTLTVNNVNDAPVVMAAIPDQIMDEDAPFSFTLDTAIFGDDDFIHGDRLTLSATLADGNDLPTWLAFDALAGTFSGMPTNGNVGIYDVRVIATDENSANASTVFVLTVNNTNDVPIVANAIADRITDEDAPFSLDLTNIFSDDDLIHGDSLTLSAALADGTELPTWLTFDVATGTFTGTPDNWQVGTYDLRVTATDLAGTSASDVFSLTVNNVNDNPVLANALNDLTTDEDAPFSFSVPAGTFDDDDFIHGDSLTLSAALADGSVLPDWLTFDATTGTFTGTPDNWQVGAYDIQVTATDSVGRSISDTFTLAVKNTNDAPVLANAIPDQAATEGVAFSYALASNTFVDDDAIHGDTLSYTASLADGSALPAWLSFDANTQTFTGTAPVDSVLTGTDGDDVLIDSDTGISGAWDIRVNATDTSGVSTDDTFTLTLQGVAGNDTLNGGKGNDVLNGGGGDDTYLYNYGDGLDTLTDYAGQDTVALGSGFSFENTVIRTEGGIAHLRFLDGDGNEGGEGVDIALNGDGTSPIEAFAFTDGGGYTLDDLLIRRQTHYGTTRADTIATGRHDDTIYAGNGTDTVHSGSGHDTLYGDNGNDALYGEGGHDRLFGGNGDDLLNGGAGNDTLEGGHGHNTLIGGKGDDTILLALGENTIRFDLGDGRDTLTTEGAEVEDNDLEFGAGIARENLWFTRSGNDLQIDVLGTTDSLTFQNWYASEHKPLEEIRTANGYELEDKQIELLVQAMAAFSPIPGSGNVLPAEMPDSLQPVLAAAWESH